MQMARLLFQDRSPKERAGNAVFVIQERVWEPLAKYALTPIMFRVEQQSNDSRTYNTNQTNTQMRADEGTGSVRAMVTKTM